MVIFRMRYVSVFCWALLLSSVFSACIEKVENEDDCADRSEGIEIFSLQLLDSSGNYLLDKDYPQETFELKSGDKTIMLNTADHDNGHRRVEFVLPDLDQETTYTLVLNEEESLDLQFLYEAEQKECHTNYNIKSLVIDGQPLVIPGTRNLELRRSS